MIEPVQPVQTDPKDSALEVGQEVAARRNLFAPATLGELRAALRNWNAQEAAGRYG